MAKRKSSYVKPLTSSPPSATSHTHLWIVLSAIVGVIGVIGGYSYLPNMYLKWSTPSKIPSVLYQEYHISRRNLDPKVSYSTYLDEKSHPVVIVGEILKQFPRWTISDVVAMTNSKRLSGFFRHNSRIFGPYYDDKRPMHNISSIQGKSPYNPNASLPVDKIERIFHQQSPHIFYSYSSSLSEINPSLEQRFDLSEMLKFNPSHSSVNLWMGMRGGVTPCHYDGYHNMYVQLSGIKHFLLFPPETRTEIGMFPFLHPSYGQCQVRPSQIAQTKELRSKRIEVLLRPGEMLYIPPFWLHEVTTVEPSVSLNVWTDIKDSAALHAIFSIPIPGLPDNFNLTLQQAPIFPIRLSHAAFENFPNRLVLGTTIVLELLRLSLPNIDDRIIVIRDLVSRYSHLIDSGTLKSYDSLQFSPGFADQIKDQIWSSTDRRRQLPVDWTKWFSDSTYTDGLSGFFIRQCLSHISTMDSRYQLISLASVVEWIAFKVGGAENSGILIQLLGKIFSLL